MMFGIVDDSFILTNATSQMSTYPPNPHPAIVRQAVSISLAVIPFGIAFGVAANEAGLRLGEAIGFSALVFSGSAQFAAVTVLADGGTVVAAVIAGVLLNLRSIAFGITMAPALRGPRWWRALTSQLMIDESTAVGSAQATLQLQRFGYLAAGVGVFVTWNTSTIIGASVLTEAGDLVHTAGIDATIPAAFLALLWPRLLDPDQRIIAVLGATIAFGTAPFLPAGVPIITAALAVLATRPWRSSP